MTSTIIIDLTAEQLQTLVVGPTSAVALTQAQKDEVAPKEAAVMRNTFDIVFERLVALEAEVAAIQKPLVGLEVFQSLDARIDIAERRINKQVTRVDAIQENELKHRLTSATDIRIHGLERRITELEAQVAAATILAAPMEPATSDASRIKALETKMAEEMEMRRRHSRLLAEHEQTHEHQAMCLRDHRKQLDEHRDIVTDVLQQVPQLRRELSQQREQPTPRAHLSSRRVAGVV
ncbi:MAG: hypothetical protein Q7V62_03700 [Actinomycetota bacterium]|nr:hypothetical protein [Actinomycetota bacterium]